MKKSPGLVFILLFFTTLSFAQTLTQTIRGSVLDADSRMPLIGATVYLSPEIGTVTDENGNFRLEKVPVGRADLALTYVGYENLQVPNIVVNSGKEVVLNLLMQESAVKMAEVTVTATRNKGEALNEMAMLSARSISPEETNRYAGGFNDPSRILANFAGITSTHDGYHHLLQQRHPPNYVQWRLDS